MQASRYLVVAAVTMACAAMAWRGDRAVTSDREAHAAAETRRLRAHFDSVDAELRVATPTSLPAAQRVRRAQLIAWLREYRDAGVFPENDRFAAPTPFFVDHRGARCAMGELLHRAGRDDIVRDVQRSRNNAYIAELADDPRLVAWLDSVGMTVTEAGRVQPQYEGIGGGPIVDDAVASAAPTAYKVGAGSLAAASLAAMSYNIIRPRGWSKWTGLAVGTAGVLAGAAGNSYANADGYASASIATGAASFAVALVRLFTPERKPSPPVAAARFGSVQLHPSMVPVAAGRVRAGLGLHATFR